MILKLFYQSLDRNLLSKESKISHNIRYYPNALVFTGNLILKANKKRTCIDFLYLLSYHLLN